MSAHLKKTAASPCRCQNPKKQSTKLKRSARIDTMKNIISIVIVIIAGLAGIAVGRHVFAGVNADNTVAWVGSVKYLKSETHTDTNNVVALAMGHRYPWTAGARPPFWALTAARGEDAATGGDVTRFKRWEEALSIVMSYNGIADYCETNGVPGIQWRHTNASHNDRIVKFWSWKDATWPQLSVTTDAGTTGVYWANLTSTGNEFSLECRAGLSGKVDGVTIGQYEAKCDVHVNAEKIWAMTNDACADDHRYIALRVFFGGVAIDVDGDGGLINKTDTENSGELNFGAGAWFKFKRVVALLKNRTVEKGIIPHICPITTEIVLPKAIRVIREASFSFMAPKSTNPGIIEWDPVFGADPEAFSLAISAKVSILLLLAAIIYAVADLSFL
jgi:hypothetical protein